MSRMTRFTNNRVTCVENRNTYIGGMIDCCLNELDL